MRVARAGFLAGVLSISVLLGLGIARLVGQDDPEPRPIVARGLTLGSKVESAIAQARDRYPHVDVEVRGLGNDGLLLAVGWVKPDPGADNYADEVRVRVEDQREATLRIFQAVARAHPPMRHFGAFEDRLLVPIWSRSQILSVEDPEMMRDFSTYSAFQLAAEIKEGYAVISGGLGEPQSLFDQIFDGLGGGVGGQSGVDEGVPDPVVQ